MEFSRAMPFVHLLGFQLKSVGDGACVIHYNPAPEHLNSFHVAHGGVVMTLLDVAMSQAARSAQHDMGAITIEMKTTFMRASKGLLQGHGRLIQRTATLAFCEAQVLDEQGQLCAASTGTFKYVKKLPTGPRTAIQDDALGVAPEQ